MSEREYMSREDGPSNRGNGDEGLMGTRYPRDMARGNENARDSSTYGEYNRMSELEGGRRGEIHIDSRRSWAEESMRIRYPREGSMHSDYGSEPSVYGEYNGMPIRDEVRRENRLGSSRYRPEEPTGIRYPREDSMNSRVREPSTYGEYNRMSLREGIGRENRLNNRRNWLEETTGIKYTKDDSRNNRKREPSIYGVDHRMSFREGIGGENRQGNCRNWPEPKGIRHPREELMNSGVRDPDINGEYNGGSYSEGTRSDGWIDNRRSVDEKSMDARYSREEAMNEDRGGDSSVSVEYNKMSGREGSLRKQWFDEREFKKTTGIKYARDDPINLEFNSVRKQSTHREYNMLKDSQEGKIYFNDVMTNSRHCVPKTVDDELEMGSMESGYKREFLHPNPKEESSLHTDFKPDLRDTYFESNKVMDSDYQFRDRGNKEASGISEGGGYSDVHNEKGTDRTPSGKDQFGNRVDKEYYRRWVYAGEDPMGLFMDYNHPKYWNTSNGKLSIDREDIMNRMGRTRTRDRY